MFLCKNCGSNMRFDPATQKLVCKYCGAAVTAHEYKESRALQAEEYVLSKEEMPYHQTTEAPSGKPEAKEASPQEVPSTYEATVMTCPQCGGELLTTDETAATFCSFCGSSVLLKSRVSDERRPDYIIPFQITKDTCKEAYRKALKKALYAPSDMAKAEQIDRFRGIYMPYWVYSFKREGLFETHGERDHRRGDYIYTKHYRVSTQIDASYDGLSFDASSSFSDNLSGAIAPFEFSQAEPFEPAYLSGFYADTNDVDSSVYTEDARYIAKDYAADQLSHSRTYRKYNASIDNIPLHTGKPKLALYPVWFLSCRNKTGDRISYAVVNGQTGKVAADLPVDTKKMLLGTLLLAIPIFFILNLLLTLTPTKALVITTILGIIGMFLANRQMNLIYQFENRLDDKGHLYRNHSRVSGRYSRKKGKPRTPGLLISFVGSMISIVVIMTVGIPVLLMASRNIVPMFLIVIMTVFVTVIGKPAKWMRRKNTTLSSGAPLKEKMKILWKPLAGIVASLIIVMLAPVSDLYYYGAAIVSMIFVGWSFWDILQLHNRLTTRPLPQFNRRGGEEYEHIS